MIRRSDEVGDVIAQVGPSPVEGVERVFGASGVDENGEGMVHTSAETVPVVGNTFCKKGGV